MSTTCNFQPLQPLWVQLLSFSNTNFSIKTKQTKCHKPEKRSFLFKYKGVSYKVGHSCVQTVREYMFLFCCEGDLLESSESKSWHIQRPVYTLFTAAALFYLDILHKNSIELCSMGCSSAAFWRWNIFWCFLRPEPSESHRSHGPPFQTAFIVRVGGVPLPLPFLEFLNNNLLLYRMDIKFFCSWSYLRVGVSRVPVTAEALPAMERLAAHSSDH